MDRLDSAIQRHDKVIVEVMKEEDQPDKESENLKESPLVPIADKVRRARYRVTSMNRTLERMTDRVEL